MGFSADPQLAAQLREEAESIVAAGQAEAAAKVAAAREDVARLTQQGQDASAQIQRLQTTLDEVRQALTASERGARDRDTTIVGLNERIAGLERQLGEREAHLMSAETKHQQARDALEHFRQASREQRDTEARQHEQAVQALQVALRRATDTVASKNDELLSLNRANARYAEQVGQLDKELRDTRRTLQTAQTRVAEAEGLRQANQALEQRVSQLTVDIEAMRREQTAAHIQWDGERAALADALQEARAQGERWGTIEAMLSNLQPTSPAIDGSSS